MPLFNNGLNKTDHELRHRGPQMQSEKKPQVLHEAVNTANDSSDCIITVEGRSRALSLSVNRP